MGQGTDAFKQGWENLKVVCVSPRFPSGSSSEKSPERANKPSSNYFNMAVTNIVSMPVADIHKKFDFVAKVAKLFEIFRRGRSLINPKELSAVGGMAGILGKLSRYRSV